MVKRRTIDLPKLAGILGAAQAAGFNVENIVAAVISVMTPGGQNSFTDEIASEIEDVVMNFSKAPASTFLAAGFGFMGPIIISEAVASFIGHKYANVGKKMRIKFW